MLQRGEKRIFDWLKQRSMGEVHDTPAVMAAAGWTESSIKTYLRKNKLAPFLLHLGDGRLKVLLDGSEISESYFHEVFTQTAPRKVALSVGDRLKGLSSEYELIEPLGRGAVGHVWSAKDLAADPYELVAVKIMMPREDLLTDSRIANIRERFRREGRNGAALTHPNVVRYKDLGDVERNPFLVMELADKVVAADLRDGPLGEDEVSDVVTSTLNALEHLHGKKLLHRDVKPANILRFGGHYKVGDLGIVRWTDFDAALTRGGTITRASVQLGSWFYMAPEQQEDPHEAEPASDIYALGVTWIELLLGKLPSPQAVGARAYALLPTSESVREVVSAMVNYAPRDRPSIADVRSVLASS